MKLILLALIASLITSCSTFRSAVDQANQNQALIAPTIALVTSVVFEKAVSPEDKAEKAKIVYGLADKLSELKFTKKPTQEEVLEILVSNLPAKGHWVTLATVLSTQYDKATKNVLDSDVEQTTAVIRQIAFGLRSATAPYLD